MKSHSTLAKYSYKVVRAILGPIIRIIWVKSHVDTHHIIKHKGGGIIAANHQSFFDFLCLVAVTKRNIHFLSAEKFFSHRVWKTLMISTGQIKVERNATDKSPVHEIVKKHLQKNHLVGIFPEGTRSKSDVEMLKAYTGVARYALEHDVPVIPVGIRGAHHIHNKDSKKLIYKKNVDVVVGEAMYFGEFKDQYKNPEVLEKVTKAVMDQIALLSGKTYPY